MAENRVIAWSDDVMKKVEDRNNKAARHTVRVYNFNEGVYEVSTGSYRTAGGMQRGGKTWRVDFNEGNCECRKHMLYHYPCSHVIAICMRQNISIEGFIHPCYSLDYLKRTYEKSFYPVKDKEQWPESERSWKLVPGDKLIRKNSSGRMKRGRYQEKRIRSDMDLIDRANRGKHCSVCKVQGHSKPTCTHRGGGRFGS